MTANKSWADISIILGGVPLIDVQEISYSYTRNYEDHYGVGDQPVSRGGGNVKYDNLTLKMSYDELKRLEDAAPNGDITKYPPFTVTVLLKSTTENPVSRTDILTNVQFKSNGRDMKQGDTKFFTTINCIFAGFNNPL